MADFEMPTEQQFIDACDFAKVVIGANGPALLIGGYVLEIDNPFHNYAMPGEPMLEVVDALAKALRRAGREQP